MSRILVGGASGLIGSALVQSCEAQGDEVFKLVRRRPTAENEIQWDPMREVPAQVVSSFDTVVHLSGESVTGRWTETKKRRIRESRVISTDHLARALAGCEKKPEIFVCASAIGYYGNRGEELLTENSPVGVGFLAEVSSEWEVATRPAADARIRTINLRTGIVLSQKGGALKPMLLPFRLGLGGKIGSGYQWWSWIHVNDFIAAVHWMIKRNQIKGQVNMTAPNPVTNAEFTQALSAALKRPAVLPVPAFAVKLALGEFAVQAILSSARVEPKKLMESGFTFKYPDIRTALENLL